MSRSQRYVPWAWERSYLNHWLEPYTAVEKSISTTTYFETPSSHGTSDIRGLSSPLTVGMGDLQVNTWFSEVERLVVHVLLGTPFIGRGIRIYFLWKGSFVTLHSASDAIFSDVNWWQRSAAILKAGWIRKPWTSCYLLAVLKMLNHILHPCSSSQTLR